jgi:5-methylcytosine-specific restriction endonuclease McrA
MRWQTKVYHKILDRKYWANGKCTPYWESVRSLALKEDNYTCQRCGKTRDLTIHHILPRSQGGSDALENLIVLCVKCHDDVELLGYRNRNIIMNSLEDDIDLSSDREITEDWHSWVYGAGKRSDRRNKQNRKD